MGQLKEGPDGHCLGLLFSIHNFFSELKKKKKEE
jgi:hypothetical protein